MGYSHQIVVLILDGRRADRGLGAEALEALRQPGGPQYGQVGLG